MADTAEEFRKLQAVEYGTYVAVQSIDVGIVRAFNVGDPVPVSHVKAYGYDAQGLVAKTTTKAAAEAKDTAAG